MTPLPRERVIRLLRSGVPRIRLARAVDKHRSPRGAALYSRQNPPRVRLRPQVALSSRKPHRARRGPPSDVVSTKRQLELGAAQ